MLNSHSHGHLVTARVLAIVQLDNMRPVGQEKEMGETRTVDSDLHKKTNRFCKPSLNVELLLANQILTRMSVFATVCSCSLKGTSGVNLATDT